jgi:hypothetical protein
VFEQHVLDVAREDVEAAPDDEVLQPVHDVQEAVLVQVPDVAGVQPAVPHRPRGQLRVVPVAEHHPRPVDADLAVLAGRHRLSFEVDDGHPDVR